MTILELREKRNKAWEAAKAFVETKRDNDGLLSAKDAATYAEIEQKVQNYSAEIARMEEMEAMETELNKPVNTPITGKPMNSGKAPEKKNPRLSILGILLTKVDRRTNFARDISEQIREVYGNKIHIFENCIPMSVRAAETTAEGSGVL